MIVNYHYSKACGLEITGVPKCGKDQESISWTDFSAPNDDEIKQMEQEFKFHPLAMEDCILLKQRSKFDDYQDYIFVVLNCLSDTDNDDDVEVQQLGIFIGHGYIVTFHYEEIEPLKTVKRYVEKKPETISKGVDYILYLIIDAFIDNYFLLLDNIDNRYNRLEDDILANHIKTDINELFILKRSLLNIRKVLTPHREMINALIRYEGIFIQGENRIFYMDAYDNLMRIFDFLDTYRELVTGSQEIYLTVVSNKMNEIMKTLTVIATIMMPLTLISSIYGMNFDNMPELHWEYGYFWVMGLMFITAMGMVMYFRSKKWF